jgi:hypothetical protein
VNEAGTTAAGIVVALQNNGSAKNNPFGYFTG